MTSHFAAGRSDISADERGVTLIELITAIALIGVVFGGLTAVLIGISRAQHSVVGMTQASAQGDVAATALDRALRNAEAVDISDGGDTLRVRTSLPGQNRCQGFAVYDDELRVQQTSDQLDAPADWTRWMPTTPVASSPPVFARSGTKIAYAFTVTADGSALNVTGAVAPRTPSGEVDAPCW